MLPLFYDETALAACVLRATTKENRSSTFLRKTVHPGYLAGGFSDLEMTWLFIALALPQPLLELCPPPRCRTRCSLFWREEKNQQVQDIYKDSFGFLNIGLMLPIFLLNFISKCIRGGYERP